MKKYCIIICLLAGFIINPDLLKAQTEKQAVVKVSGEVTTPLEISKADLQKFEQNKVTRKDRDGKEHTYSGVILATILQKAGVTLGKDLKGENLTKYLLAEASDGYQVTFALAELDKDFTDRLIILADQIDGKPLPDADGPFRIIVQDEKKPARCMKQVTNLHIAFAKQ
jgi:DMSO/TMAO reductase YedYZ molybdopterin-dependent catalytic subunit